MNQIAPAAANAARSRPFVADIGVGWDLPRQSSLPISARHIGRRSIAISTSHRVRDDQPFAREVAMLADAPAADSWSAATIAGSKLPGRLPQARLAPTRMQAVAA